MTADWIEVYLQERRRPGYVIENGNSIASNKPPRPHPARMDGRAMHGSRTPAPPGPFGSFRSEKSGRVRSSHISCS